MSIDKIFAYYWHLDEKEEEITSIRIYGLDKNNKNICLRITDFTPYIYLELPENINWKLNAQILGNKLDEILKDNRPIKKTLIYKHKLYGAHINTKNEKKEFPFLFCSFSNKEDIKRLSYIVRKPLYIFGIGTVKIKMHEQDASPILQFVSCRDIPTAGWIKFSGKIVPEIDKITLCDKEYIVKSVNVKKIENDIVASPKIMGFDIEVNSSNPSAFPSATKQGDKIFQISCVFSRDGFTEDMYDIRLLTLGKVDQDYLGNVKISEYETEADLLIGFTDLIREENPNLIAGYNILGFDIQYMIDRAKSDYTRYCINEFDMIGFHKYNHSPEEKIVWSSSAYKNQEFKYLSAEGRIFVDLLPLIKRDYKFNNYQLKTVSQELLKDTKEDLSHKGIFKCYRIGIKKENDGTYSEKAIKAMSVCGSYCIKDSVLVVKLMEKMQCWIGLCEQARVCNIDIFSLYTQGQQKKVYAQVYKYCIYQNIVVEKDAYVTKENERYVGAHVFPPVPGIYDRVLPFDFCLTGDTLITMSNGYSKRIENLLTDELILGYNKKGLQNFSTINGLQKKGLKETIKIFFQDGRTITSTLDHKFMLNNGEWCEAKDLKDKCVMSGIEYPEDIKCDLEENWVLKVKDYEFNMKSYETREQSLSFSRMLGYILSDGSIYKTKIKTGFRYCVEATFGTLIDANNFKRDISKFSIIDVTIQEKIGNKKGLTYNITLPSNISKMIHSLEDIIVGKRSTQYMKLPKFILDENCPISIIREFLGGLYGGDGTSPYLTRRNNFGSISFKWTIIKKYLDSMINIFEQLKILHQKLGINITIYKPILVNYGKDSIIPYDIDINPRYDIQLNLLVEDTYLFSQKIGFKYCVYKACRLTIASSYQRMCNKVREQHSKIVTRTNQLIDKYIINTLARIKGAPTFKNCLKKAQDELLENEPVINIYSLSSVNDIGYRRHEAIRNYDKPRKLSLQNKKFPNAKTYVIDIGAESWFSYDSKHVYCVKSQDDYIPCFLQKIIDIRCNGMQEVFDIEVKDIHNFLANGIISHNCSLYPTTIIAYNIDYSTIVFDESIPDKLCNVMSWTDHISCIVEGSIITANGFGIKIEKLQNNINLILSHSGITNLLEYKKQSKFFNQGKKECIEITFVDGSTLKCTPDHKIMTSKNEWVEAKELVISKTKIKKGICYPETNFEEYICGFEINCINLKFQMCSIKDVEKFCKFARIFGFLYTDGCIQKNRATCYMRDIVDVNCIINDIYDICSEKIIPKFVDNGISKLYHVGIPYSIHNSCLWMLGDGYGKQINKNSYLPSFILNKNCPTIIKREFLAGMFGGDELAPGYCFTTKNYTTAGLCASKSKEKLDNLKEFFESIQTLLFNDFNINSYINGPYYKQTSYYMRLHINVNDLISFHKQIGYRYCTYKMLKLEIMCSYKNLINNVFDQRHKCFPSFEKYITDLNVFDMFVDNKISISSSIYGKDQQSIDTIPYYIMDIINIKSIGIQSVYDIEINDNHSFLANGVVVHNCEHDPKVIEYQKISKYIDNERILIKELMEKRDNKSYKDIKLELNEKIKKKREDLSPFLKQRSDIKKTFNKIPMCEKRHYRFLKEPKGVIPTILQNLLDARANTRKEIKDHKKEIKLLQDEIKNENTENKIKDLQVLNNVLEKRQLSYKISANSMYGIMGVRKGILPFMAGAMCTTYMGRVNIEKVADTITSKYKGKLVYGDSVTEDTPILCRIDGKIYYRTIDNLSNYGWKKYRDDKEIADPKNIEVWTENGFTKIKKIIRHKTSKDIYRVLTHTGIVDVTEDHGLLNENKEKISPKEIIKGSKLLIHDLPINCDYNNSEINKDLAFVMGLFYADGSCGDYDCSSGRKCSWAINKSNKKLLEKCSDILNNSQKNSLYEIKTLKFKILDTLKSSKVLKLVPTGKGINLFVKKWRDSFYDKNKYKKVPDEILWSNMEIRQSFLDGYYSGDGDKDINGYYRFDNKGKIGTASLFFLTSSLGYKVSINTREDKPNIFRLTCTKGLQRKQENSVKKIKLLGKTEQYVYDLETENHHFSAGIGKLIVHNTDSNYISFPHLKTSEESWDYALKVAEEVSALFPRPMELAFEEAIYWQYLILTKKRYMYRSCGRDGVVENKIGKRGVLLSRRDTSLLVRKIYERLIELIFEKVPVEDVLYYLLEELNKICSNSYSYRDFVITKAIGDIGIKDKYGNLQIVQGTDDKTGKIVDKIGQYKIKKLPVEKTALESQLKKKDASNENEYYGRSLPAIVQLAEKMRNRGMRVDTGTRQEYVITDNNISNSKQYEKIESIDYFINHSSVLKINFGDYIKLMSNSVDQVLNVAFNNNKKMDIYLKMIFC